MESSFSRWATARLSEKSLKNELKLLCPNGKVTNCVFESPEKFAATVKCHAKEMPLTCQGENADSYIQRFSSFTGTAWIAQTGFTQVKRLLHQKVYTCDHYNRKNRDANIPNTASNEQEQCPAEITFNLNRKGSKKLFSLNMAIKVRFHHTHRVYDPALLQAGNLSAEMETKLKQYISHGSTAVAAKYFHELSLLDEHPDNPQILSDTSMNPSLTYVTYMYHMFQDCADADQINLYDIMQEKKDYYDYHGSTLHFPIDDAQFSMQTPAMKRTMRELGFATVFINTIIIPEGPTVTYVAVPTMIGALPIGCNVITSQKRHVVSADGYDSLRLYICIDSDIEFEPSIYFINDQSIKHRLSFGQGKDKKKLWATYDLCKSAWMWLNDDDNNIDKSKRHELMVLISNLYHSSKEKADQLYKELIESVHMTQCPTLKEYLADSWSKREEWSCDADDIQMNNSLVQLSFRCLRELLLKYCRGFNSPLMVDVVGKILENQQRRILQSLVENRDIVETYTKYLTKANVSKEGEKLFFDGSEVRKVTEHEYQIINQNNPSKYITLRTDTMMCDCLYGKRGEFCAHLVAIINSVPESVQIPELKKADKYIFTYIRGEVDSKGEPKPQERASPVRYNSEEECEEGLEDIRGVAIPIHDARGLVPGGHESSYEEEEMLRDLQEEYPYERPQRRNNRRRRLVAARRMNARHPTPAPFSGYLYRDPIPDRLNDYSRLNESPIGHTGKSTIPISVNSYKLLANKDQKPSMSAPTNDIPSTSNSDKAAKTSSTSGAKTYENVLKLLNNEFERLNKFFSENPNDTNLEAMTQLAIDLGEVKPEDKTEANDNNSSNRKAKKRRQSSLSSDFDYYSDTSDK